MKKDTIKSNHIFCGVLVIVLFMVLSTSLTVKTSHGQTDNDSQATQLMFEQAHTHLLDGEYKEAIAIYDDILDASPENVSALNMKGIAYNNLQEYENSLKQFFKTLQYRPDDLTALTGMGIGFGNLGEYKESKSYFERASSQKPDSAVINNYVDFVNKIITKYPYTPTEKPARLTPEHAVSIPEWVKTTAGWWSDGDTSFQEFVQAFTYLAKNNVIEIPPMTAYEMTKDGVTLEETRRYTKSWSENQISNEEFASKGIRHIIAKSPADIQVQFQKSQRDLDQESDIFKTYLKDIAKNISKEKRYIEYSNPSSDVIKKFLRDYKQWNFEEQVKVSSTKFPNPTYEKIDETYIVTYNVFINGQPPGLPLDHIGTLENSFEFWQKQELFAEDVNAKVKFNITNLRHEANIWVTWVVRDLGEGVLGHAHLGKGVVEVTLGDYRCDGSFQLYNVDSVEYIMTHELGHSIGLKHGDNRDSIMYPEYTPSYAYCLLN